MSENKAERLLNEYLSFCERYWNSDRMIVYPVDKYKELRAVMSQDEIYAAYNKRFGAGVKPPKH